MTKGTFADEEPGLLGYCNGRNMICCRNCVLANGYERGKETSEPIPVYRDTETVLWVKYVSGSDVNLATRNSCGML